MYNVLPLEKGQSSYFFQLTIVKELKINVSWRVLSKRWISNGKKILNDLLSFVITFLNYSYCDSFKIDIKYKKRWFTLFYW